MSYVLSAVFIGPGTYLIPYLLHGAENLWPSDLLHSASTNCVTMYPIFVFIFFYLYQCWYSYSSGASGAVAQNSKSGEVLSITHL